MTDPDATALLRSIVRYPDDDTPRYVYADWLQENGRPEEGEFLRVQCRLARAEPDDSDYPDQLEREEELRLWLGTHVPGPRPTFPGGLSVEGGSWWWPYTERGFPRFLEFDGYQKYGVRAMRALASALERAFEALPTRWLVVRDITTAQFAALLKQPVLAKVSQLTVQLAGYGGELDDAARLLANCRHLRNLNGLSVRFGFGDAGCVALAGGPWEELNWFSATCHEIGPAGIEALGGASWFRNLRELTFDEDLSGLAFVTLARLAPFPRLHTLDLSRGLFMEAEWLAFAASRAFPRLGKLVLDEAGMSGGALSALTTGTGFTLRALSLCECGLPAGSGAVLAAAPWADALRFLDLSHNALPAADMKAVLSCKRFGELRQLNLAGNALGPTCLSAAAANPALRELRALNLSGGSFYNRALTPTHFDRFLSRLNMPELRALNLSGRPVGPRAVRRLTDEKFTSLTRLGLAETGLTDPALAALLSAPALANLIHLELDGNDLSTAPERLADRTVLPQLAACSLSGNAIPAAVARKLRRRPGVRL
jgi:uncharacterized protein (TIGR02996 family)